MEKDDIISETLDKTSTNASEYNSAGSYSDGENGKRNTSKHSEDESEDFSGSESDERVNFEREEGDGQESAPVKKVDDDEDKKNPQYIPKRGTFYEHDDRTADDGDASDKVDSEKSEKENKKKVWQDKKEQWNHDKFNDNDQAPKTRAELISIYGYDIRNEDGPPRARRRRRYGRGPNKYTRNWEDEDAYGKPVVVYKGNKKPRSRRAQEEAEIPQEIEEADVQENIKEEETERIAPVIVEEKTKTVPMVSDDNSSRTHTVDTTLTDHQSNKLHGRPGTGRIVKPSREIKDSDYKGFTKSRQYKSSKSDPQVPQRNQKDRPFQNSANSKNLPTHDIERDMSKMNIHDGSYKNNSKHNSQRQASVPPRLQGEQKGSKRYSSLRQRSLPETAAPPFGQHPTYYANDYNQQAQLPQQPNLIQANSIHPTSAQIPQMQPTLTPIPAQVSVTTAPILQGPPQFAPPFPQPAAFLQPAVAAAPFMPPQPAPIINFVQSPAQFPQPPYQGFQQQFNPVNPPTDLYQPQGGITYYSAQEQQIAQRIAPLKRPKAAIPIIAPPEHRGRGRSINQMEPLNQDVSDSSINPTNEADETYEDASVMQ